MDNICVAIRVRPINQREASATQQQPWFFDESNVTLLSLNTGKPLSTYAFDNIYGSDVPTQSLYDGVARNIVKSSMDGINGTIFAYGQTSSGKTFTMQGDSEIPGIIPLAIRDIFSHIENCPSREFLLRVSYMEIYNEVIQDLLNPEAKNLKIHEDPEKGIYVGGIKEAIVVSTDQVLSLKQSGEDRRHVGATNMNEHSSRSHTIFRMVIESRERSARGDRNSVDGAVKVSMLNLVDLAGSERIAHTGAEGIRQKEGGHINKSLLALSTVIAKLSEGQKQLHIPYRDSKLTRILQTALGGNARTGVICTVTPAAVHQEETLSTIKFATRAKNIKNKPVINEVANEATMLRKYKDEIHTLKAQLAQREVVIEQKAEDNSTKQSELEILREQIDKLKGVIIHSSAPTQGDASRRRPKRSSRRETWCPGEAGAVGPGAAAGIGGTSSTKMSEGSSESDLTADIDKELGFGNFRIPDLPFGSGPDSSSAYPFVSRKRLYPSDSPLPISIDLSYSSEQPTPKQFRPLITPEKLPAFQRAEMLLSAKKEYTPTKDSGETVELRKEVARQKGVIVENQATISRLQSSLDSVTGEKQALQQAVEQTQTENEAIRQELEKMLSLTKSSYADLEEARAQIEELQDDSSEWAEEKVALETALEEAQKQMEKAKREGASLQQEVDALNEMLSEAALETDSWKTRFGDLQTEHELAQANWSEREEELMALQAEASHVVNDGEGSQKSEESVAFDKNYNQVVAEMKVLTDAHKELEEVLARTQEQHIVVVDDWKTKHLELHNEFEKYSDYMTHEREKLDNENSELREQLAERDDDVDRLTCLLDEKDADRSVLPEAGDVSELRALLDEARQECGRLTVVLQEQTERLSVMEQKNSEQTMQLQTIEVERAKVIDEDSKHAEERTRLNDLLVEKEKECERLSQLAGSAQVLQREHKQSLLSALELREQLREAQQRLEAAQIAESKAEGVAQAQLADARQEVASLSVQITKIREETATQVAVQASRCQQLEGELQNVTEKFDHQMAMAGSHQQRTKEAEREVQFHLDSYRALEGNANHTTKRAQQLQTSADLSRQQCDSLLVKVAELTRENQKLEGKLSDAERMGHERVELMESVAKFKNELAQLNSAYERQREEHAKVQQQAKRLQDSLDQTSHELDAHKNLLSASEEKALQATTDYHRLRSDVDEREATHRRDQILHTTQLERKDNEIQRVSAELAGLQEECEVMRKDLTQLAAAAKDYDRLSNELAQVKTRFATEAAQWKEESTKLKKELKASSSTNNSAEKERDALSREMEKLKQKMEALDGKYKQVTQNSCSLEADKVAADRELKQLRKQNADLERTNEKLKAHDNKSKENAAATVQLTRTYDTLSKTYDSLVKTSEKLKLDLDAKTAELMREIEVKVQLDNMLAEAKDELEVKTVSIETLTREKSEEARERKETDQVLLITVGKLDDAQRKLAQVEEKVSAITLELAEARKAKDQAEEEKEKLCGQLTEMHYAVEENRAEWSAKEFEYSKERETGTAELATVKAELSQREATLDESKVAVEEKTAALQSAVAELDVLKGEAVRLQEELAGVKEELERAKAETAVNQQELESAAAEIEHAQRELRKVSAAFTEAGNEADKLLSNTSEELKDSKERLHRAQEEIGRAEEEAERLRGCVEESSLELKVNKEWVAELQQQVEELKHVEQEKNKMGMEIKSLLNDFESIKDMAREMEKRAVNAEGETRSWRERAEQVVSRLAAAEEENRMWQDRIGELQRILENMDGQMKTLRRENEEMRREVEQNRVEKSGEVGQKTGGVSEEELANVIAERDQLRAEVEESMTQLEDYSQKLDKMMDEAHAAKAVYDAQFKYQKKIRELLEKLSKFEMDAKRANASCAQKDIEIEALRNELEKRQQEVANDDGTLTKADLLSEVTRLEGVVNEMSAELEATKNAAEKQSVKTENMRKAKMDFDNLYQDRRKKVPFGDRTNVTPM